RLRRVRRAGDADLLHQRQEARRRSDAGQVRRHDRAAAGQELSHRIVSRIGVLAALLMLPAVLAGCGGNTLLPPTTELTPDKAPDTGGGAYPSAEDTASTGPERFNPFADPSAKPAGGRQAHPK